MRIIGNLEQLIYIDFRFFSFSFAFSFALLFALQRFAENTMCYS